MMKKDDDDNDDGNKNANVIFSLLSSWLPFSSSLNLLYSRIDSHKNHDHYQSE